MFRNKSKKPVFIIVSYAAYMQTQLNDIFNFYYTIKS